VVMLRDFKDDEALLGTNNVGDLASLHSEGLVFEFLGQGTSLEAAKIAALRSCGSIGILFGDVLKTASLMDLGQQVLCFGLCRGQPLRIVACIRVAFLIRRDQDFTQANLFGLLHLAFVFVVKLL